MTDYRAADNPNLTIEQVRDHAVAQATIDYTHDHTPPQPCDHNSIEIISLMSGETLRTTCADCGRQAGPTP